MNSPQDSPMSSPRAGSERSSMSAFDADTMYNTARSQAFDNNNSRPPAPPCPPPPLSPDHENENSFFPPPPVSAPPLPISAPTSPHRKASPPPVPLRRSHTCKKYQYRTSIELISLFQLFLILSPDHLPSALRHLHHRHRYLKLDQASETRLFPMIASQVHPVVTKQ